MQSTATNPGPKVFISSSVIELRDTRAVVATTLQYAGFEPCMSEVSGFLDNPVLSPHATCIENLEQCQLVVGIIGRRFGEQITDGWGPYIKYEGRNATYAEIKYAFDHEKRLYVYILDEVLAYYELWKLGLGKKLGKRKSVSLGYDDFDKTMELVHEIKNLGRAADKPTPWISAFKDVRAIVEDLKLRLLGDLSKTWNKLENKEELRAEVVAQRMAESCPPEELQEKYGKIVETPLFAWLSQTIEVRRAAETQERVANEQWQKAKTTESFRDLEHARRMSVAAAENERTAKRQFLLQLLVPELPDPPRSFGMNRVPVFIRDILEQNGYKATPVVTSDNSG